MEDSQLNEAYLVVLPVLDDENLLVDSEIQVMDDVLADPYAKENLIVVAEQAGRIAAAEQAARIDAAEQATNTY
ncbi:hypothetical protein Tco_1010545 [Tanacetum coccineum]